MSSPTAPRRPNGRRDTAPSPARPADTRPGHIRSLRPGAVFGEFLPAWHRRNRRRGHDLLRPHRLLAVEHGRQERVALLRADVAPQRIGTVDRGSLVGPHLERQVRAGHLGCTLHDRHGGRLLCIPGSHGVTARRGQADQAPRRVHGVGLAWSHRAEAQVCLALRLGRLEARVVQRRDIQFGARSHDDAAGGNLDLCLSVCLRPERIARGDGIIRRRRAPLLFALDMKRDRAVDAGEPADAGGRIAGRQRVQCAGRRLRRRELGDGRPRHELGKDQTGGRNHHSQSEWTAPRSHCWQPFQAIGQDRRFCHLNMAKRRREAQRRRVMTAPRDMAHGTCLRRAAVTKTPRWISMFVPDISDRRVHNVQHVPASREAAARGPGIGSPGGRLRRLSGLSRVRRRLLWRRVLRRAVLFGRGCRVRRRLARPRLVQRGWHRHHGHGGGW